MGKSFGYRLTIFWNKNRFFILFVLTTLTYLLLNILVIFRYLEILLALRFNIIFGIILQIGGLSCQNIYTNKNAEGYTVRNPWYPPTCKEIKNLFIGQKKYNASVSANFNIQGAATGKMTYTAEQFPNPGSLDNRIKYLELKLHEVSRKVDANLSQVEKQIGSLNDMLKRINIEYDVSTNELKEDIKGIKTSGYPLLKKAYGITFIGTLILLVSTAIEVICY